MITHCHRLAYWHSENVTCYVAVDKCPSCGCRHFCVILYTCEDHVELPPHDFLNNVKLPCGGTTDLILERSSNRGY